MKDYFEKRRGIPVIDFKDFSGARKGKFATAISRLFRAYNRHVVPSNVDAKAEDFVKLLDRIEDAEILPFFDHVMRGEDALPSDKRLREVQHVWKKGHKTNNVDLSDIGFYDLDGNFVRHGTYEMVYPIFLDRIIHHLSNRQIELLIKARLGIVEHGDPDLEKLLATKLFFTKGKFQVPRENWGEAELEHYEKIIEFKKNKMEYAKQLEEDYSKQEAA